jgi:glycosyltransferase involved in cell wall biosynthesis
MKPPAKSSSYCRIAVDGNEANVAARVGSNHYAFELLKELEHITRQLPEIEWSILLTQSPLNDLPKERAGWHYIVISPKPLATQLGLPIHLFLHKGEYDVFYTPGHYAPRWTGVPYVSSVMDLAFLHFPEQFRAVDLVQLRDWTAYSVKKAAGVVAISEATKKDVSKAYGTSSSHIVVAPPGFTPPPRLSAARCRALRRKLGVTWPYILYVGTLQPRKNLERLVEAFELLHQRQAGSGKRKLHHRLVIAGKLGWLTEPLLKRVAASPLSDQIVLLGFVSEEEKRALYEGAATSVLVGLYEGFGIPPLESLAAGVVPVVANTTSLPEVVGKAGILVDPLNPKDISLGLWRALTLTPANKQKLLAHGRTQLTKYTWTKSAWAVLALLQKVATKA